MTRLTNISPQFVEFVPRTLEEGVIYVSITYKTAVHQCACGCGSKIVTPISPARWRFTYDGESVSLYPSIGNWSYRCESHYWIRGNRIVWAEKWSRQKIEVTRETERLARQKHHADQTHFEGEQVSPRPPGGRRWLRRIRAAFNKRRS